MIDVACNDALCANSPPIRARHRSSTTTSSAGAARLAGGPPAFNHDDTVAG